MPHMLLQGSDIKLIIIILNKIQNNLLLSFLNLKKTLKIKKETLKLKIKEKLKHFGHQRFNLQKIIYRQSLFQHRNRVEI